MGTFGTRHNNGMFVLVDQGDGLVGYPTDDVTLRVWDAASLVELDPVVVPAAAKGSVAEFTAGDTILMGYFEDGVTPDPNDPVRVQFYASREMQTAGPAALSSATAAYARADEAYTLAEDNGPGSPGPAGPAGVGAVVQAATGTWPPDTETKQLRVFVGPGSPPARPVAEASTTVALWAVTSS